MQANITGANVAVGSKALNANITGPDNVAVGTDALLLNTTGACNTAVGNRSLDANTEGDNNTAVGTEALTSNVSGDDNVAVGKQALKENTATGNVAIGSRALKLNTSGVKNNALGMDALGKNSTGNHNNAIGTNALRDTDTGIKNIAIGTDALRDNTDGDCNTAVGHNALIDKNSGNNNIAVGCDAGSSLSSGSDNIYIGNVGTAESGTIRIGSSADHTTNCYIQAIHGKTVEDASDLAVLIDDTGKLGTAPSSRRFKENITELVDDSADLMKLRPVSFVYKGSRSKTKIYGLIAEEVDEVYPELVAHDKEGQAYAVKYHVLPALLLKEVQRNHTSIEALKAKNGQLKDMIHDLVKRMSDLEARA